MIAGTLRWLAPEQLKCQPVDARTDLFAVGLVLYTMLTGRDPYADTSGRLELLHAQLNVEPNPPSRNAKQAIAPELDAVVRRALAKDPGRRVPSAEDFALDLERITGVVAPPASSSQPVLIRTAATHLPQSGGPVTSVRDGAQTLVSGSVDPPPESPLEPDSVTDDKTRSMPRAALFAADASQVAPHGYAPPDGTSPEPDPFTDEETQRRPCEVAASAPHRGTSFVASPDALDTRCDERRRTREAATLVDVAPLVAPRDEAATEFTPRATRPRRRATLNVTVLTVGSTVFFSVVLLVLFRYFGVH